MKHVIRCGKITLLMLFILAMGAYLAMPLLPAKADPADAFHSEWVLIRDTADEDGASFAAVYDLTTEGNFANKDSSSVADGGAYQISPRAGLNNRWMFSFCGKGYNGVDDTFSFNLVGWSRDNGMLQVIAEGTCTLGTQAVVVYPDGGDALGETVTMTGVVYTHATLNFGKTDIAVGVSVNEMLYAVSDNETKLTSGFLEITTRTDDDNVICSGATSTANTTATVYINPAMWADTISLDETTKWTSAIDGSTSGTGNKGTIEVINSGDNEVAGLVVDLKGIDWVQFVIYDADAATSEQAGDVTVYGRKF
ncbi:hypothetical protein KAR91_57390 [Candidatus Pacearchaeota archaeon]|nr:hypothetical protein [Candidatus Pacearchaeota archaeon]